MPALPILRNYKGWVICESREGGGGGVAAARCSGVAGGFWRQTVQFGRKTSGGRGPARFPTAQRCPRGVGGVRLGEVGCVGRRFGVPLPRDRVAEASVRPERCWHSLIGSVPIRMRRRDAGWRRATTGRRDLRLKAFRQPAHGARKSGSISRAAFCWIKIFLSQCKRLWYLRKRCQSSW